VGKRIIEVSEPGLVSSRPISAVVFFFSLFIYLLSCITVGASERSFADQGLSRLFILRTTDLKEGKAGEETVAVFLVETVSDPDDRKRGLSGRDRMPEDRGMIFVLDPGQQNFFWMKGMKFSIDILVFDSGRRLIDLYSDLLPCDACPIYGVAETAAYALEINAGMAKKYGIRPGDVFVIRDH